MPVVSICVTPSCGKDRPTQGVQYPKNKRPGFRPAFFIFYVRSWPDAHNSYFDFFFALVDDFFFGAAFL